MNFVRDRADASWAPARFRYAIFRLAALAVASRLRSEPQDGIVRVIDSDQNPIESFVIAIWQAATLVCYFVAVLSPFVGIAISVPIAIVLTSIGVHVVILGFGYVAIVITNQPEVDHTILASRLSMAFLSALAVAVSFTRSWVRWVGVAFVFAILINAVAAVLMRVLRSQVEHVNRERGVTA